MKMSQITIDTNKLLKRMLVGIVIIILVVGTGVLAYNAGRASVPPTQTVVEYVTPAPTPTPAPVMPTYPSVVTFTVLSTTTSTGYYQVLTTAGQILILPDYTTWDYVRPQYTYTANVVGMSGSAYYINNVVLISHPVYRYRYPQEYPVYYEWNNRYYQYDGHRTDPVSYKSVQGENVIHEPPPDFGIFGLSAGTIL
jgi:hypothetical protein